MENFTFSMNWISNRISLILGGGSLKKISNYFKKNKLVAEPTFYLKISFSHVNHPHKNFKMLNQIIDTDCKSTCTDLLIVILEQTPHINFSVIIPFKPSRSVIRRCVYITHLYQKKSSCLVCLKFMKSLLGAGKSSEI